MQVATHVVFPMPLKIVTATDIGKKITAPKLKKKLHPTTYSLRDL
jgi:hypothetical protein